MLFIWFAGNLYQKVRQFLKREKNGEEKMLKNAEWHVDIYTQHTHETSENEDINTYGKYYM